MLELSNYINFVLVLVTFGALMYSRRQNLIYDSPRLVIRSTGYVMKQDKQKMEASCTVTNAGNGVALQTFLLIKIDTVDQDYYYLSKPENIIRPFELQDRIFELTIDKPNDVNIKKSMEFIVISIDFFENLHVATGKFPTQNEHLENLMTPTKHISKMNYRYHYYKKGMEIAKEQGNTYVNEKEEQYKRRLKELDEIFGLSKSRV
ncbi:hypothetical protein [Salipaludibacillus daqingensis]|uniref:hypothetical protein n=1 Tax=Salipaludibacillus daqingensis TaxID=3041001 RepID=UPI0024748940|nr:hypothetical protein [Salipaludibacillus daqingensis]